MFPPQPFGFVAGKWVLSKGDTTADEDREPDYIPVPEGALTFTPVLPHRTVPDPTDDPAGYAGILNTPVQGRLNGRGQLIDAQGEPHLALAVGRYRVTYDFGLTSWPDHDIDVTSEHTLSSPLWIPTASPIPTGPGIVQVVTEEARLAAEAAATSAEAAALSATLAALAAEAAADGITALNTLRVDTTVGTRIIATINGQDHMLYGDTGWRTLTSWDAAGTVTGQALPNGLIPTDGQSGSIQIRRQSDSVTVTMVGYTLTGSVTLPLPTGFRAGSSQNYLYGTFIPTQGVMRPFSVGASALIMSAVGGSYPIVGNPTYRAAMPFTSAEPWPTV